MFSSLIQHGLYCILDLFGWFSSSIASVLLFGEYPIPEDTE